MDETLLSEFISEDEGSSGRSTLPEEFNEIAARILLAAGDYDAEFVSSDESGGSLEFGSSLWTGTRDEQPSSVVYVESELDDLNRRFAAHTVGSELQAESGESAESFVTAATQLGNQSTTLWTQPNSQEVNAPSARRPIKFEVDESNDGDVSSCGGSSAPYTQMEPSTIGSPQPAVRPVRSISPILPLPSIERLAIREPADGQRRIVKRERQSNESSDIFAHLNSSTSRSELEEGEIRSDAEEHEAERTEGEEEADDGRELLQAIEEEEEEEEPPGQSAESPQISLDESRITKRPANCLKEDREYLAGLRGVAINDNNRDHVVQQVFAILNRQVFGGHFPADFKFFWNTRFVSTLAQWNKCSVSISLSTKLLTEGGMLLDSMCHELIHAAINVIDGSDAVRCHNDAFKDWAARVHNVFPNVRTSSQCFKKRTRRPSPLTDFRTPAPPVPFRWHFECDECERLEKRQYRNDMPDPTCSCGRPFRITRIGDPPPPINRFVTSTVARPRPNVFRVR